MKFGHTSTAMATLFAVTLTAGTTAAQGLVAVTDVTEAMFRDATLYIAEEGDALTGIGRIEALIYNEADDLDAVLVDIGTLFGTGDRVVAIDVDRLYPLPVETETEIVDFRIDWTRDELSALPLFVDQPDVPRRIELTAEIEYPGTGLTTQSGPGNVTSETIGKDLTDAREPIAGDFDVQEEIVEPDVLFNDD